ncbi:MAG TPA: hypothetical protein VMB23_01020 [Spirochaetia bacterium]|nr:hypothetical protein [Spirochaetia bacterium]
MQEKSGRPRQLVFRGELGMTDPGTQWMVGMFFELGDRVLDQVEHLPEAVLQANPPNSYLSPAKVILHLVGTDMKRLPGVVGTFPPPAYAPEVARSQGVDFDAIPTQGIDVVSVLRSHLDFRRTHWQGPLTTAGLLDEPIDLPYFETKRDLLGHLIWHWSFHSGHLGAVTLQAGYEYLWTSAPKPVVG